MPPVQDPSDKEPGKLPYRPCAGIMLVNTQGLVFAGRRIDSPAARAGAWQMPQGGIDEGETPVVAAWREMEEEIGTSKALLLGEAGDWLTYDLPPDLLGKAWKGRFRGQKQKWFVFQFQGADSDINIQTRHPEFSRWQWMRADDLLKSAVAFKRDVYARVFEEFSEFLG